MVLLSDKGLETEMNAKDPGGGKVEDTLYGHDKSFEFSTTRGRHFFHFSKFANLVNVKRHDERLQGF